jgi:SET domain-containing protein
VGPLDIIMPHKNIYTRLQPSSIHGIGVYAIRDIPRGTNIFLGDEGKTIWISKDKIKNIDPELKKLYYDFCVIKKDKLGCPKNFNSLTAGWYLNESRDNPNVRCDEGYDFFATRDIKKGEELTVDYSTL